MLLLDAVNLILPKLGEHRVTRVDVKHPTLAIIIPEVENEVRTLLLRGWWFNEYDYDALPSPEGRIAIGSDVLSFTPIDGQYCVLRDGELYDPSTRSYVWTAKVRGRIQEYVEFDSLPESAQQRVWYGALINAFATDIGMSSELQLWMGKVAEAESTLLAEHIRQRKYSTKQSRKWRRLKAALRG